jgi:hypothetical protein
MLFEIKKVCLVDTFVFVIGNLIKYIFSVVVDLFLLVLPATKHIIHQRAHALEHTRQAYIEFSSLKSHRRLT